MSAPTLAPATSPPQHMAALKRANEVRLARSELKRQIAHGQITVADVIRDRPWEAETMGIGELLMCQYRWGRTRMRRFCAGIPMLETKTIGSMTDRQRHVLIQRFGGYRLTG